MTGLRRSVVAGLALLAHPATGAAPADLPWSIYSESGSPDDHGSWSNVMAANGAALTLDLADRSQPFAGGTAARLTFSFGPAPGSWAGLAVASVPGYWGESPGPGFDLSGAGRLVFAVRGAAGGEGIRVKVATAGDAPFGDSAPLPFDTGWLRLTSDWQTVSLPVDGRALTRVVIPLMVIANRAHNPSGRATLFLDAVRFER